MRRTLETTDDVDADRQVAEMNSILADPSWWNASKRREAEVRFSPAVVRAFYDEIQAGREDPEKLRQDHIRLPTREDGYARVLFVGTTGAGKTSLLRQLIGSDPDDDRFPSTAPGKTTIADIEVIQADCDYEAVVTFFTEFQIQANVEECVADACLSVLQGAPKDKIADRFLNHRDQKFRLCYILGSWRDGHVGGDEDDDLSFDDGVPRAIVPDTEDVPDEVRAKNRETVEGYLERISSLTRSVQTRLAKEIGDTDIEKIPGPDREAARQLIEENFEAYLYEDEEFHELVQDVLSSVRSRFDLLEEAGLKQRQSGWPEFWLLKTADRTEFMRKIRWFSSNYWPQFGRLLTPLVQGIRVKGRLFPDLAVDQPKLALIDGQGLGHTPDSSSSVTTHITRRFDQVDVILLVDDAQHPMQASPLSVLRAVVSSGHREKLAIAFTHFDLIKGQNLPKFGDKRSHVMASVLNVLSSLRDVLGAPTVRALEHGIDGRCFMLGGVDRALKKLPSRAADYMRLQLVDLVRFFQAAIVPPPPPEACPIYDPTGISFAVQEAINRFQGKWLARLGLGTYEGVRKEHWTRVKALNRRIAGELDIEYDTLQPVADLATELRESISLFLNTPLEWTRRPADEQEEQTSIDRVRGSVSATWRDLATKRVIESHLSEWRVAYDGVEYRGTGSTFRRAKTIRNIYDAAAPLPDAVMTAASVAFLSEIRRIVTAAIEASGGQVRLEETK